MLSIINGLKKHKIARSVLSVVLALAVLCSALSMVALIPAFAEKDIWDGTTQTAPKANKDGIYEIGTAAELAYVVDNDGIVDGQPRSFILTSDIYLNDVDKVNWETGTAIGNYQINSWFRYWKTGNIYHYFKGNIDGAGHTVYGLYFNMPAEGRQQYDAAALIPGVAADTTVTIKNLAVDKAYVNYANGASAFVGYAFNNATLTIQNSYAGADVTLIGADAGVFRAVARNNVGCSLENCYSLATTTGSATYGLIAFNWEVGKFTFKNCYNANGPLNFGGGPGYYCVAENSYSTEDNSNAGGGNWLNIGSNWISADKMQGPDALTNSAKMPQLNAGDAYEATDSYPILKVFKAKDNSSENTIEIWDGKQTAPSKGTGTAQDPYKISSPAELAYVIGSGGGADMHYILTRDIYLNDIEKINWKTGAPEAGYTPNSWFDNTPFQGTIDGNGYTVYGLYYNYTGTQGWAVWGNGLIPNVAFGTTVTIKNLGVDNAYVRSKHGASAFVGAAGKNASSDVKANTVIEQCYVGADVTLSGYAVGAFRGAARGSFDTIKNSYSLATLNTQSSSGLVGEMWSCSLDIDNCYMVGYGVTDALWVNGCSNIYSTVVGLYTGETTLRTEANMKDLDVFTNTNKMPNLNVDGVFVATEGYPVLAGFDKADGEGEEGGGDGGEDTYGPEMPAGYDIWDGSTKTQPAEGKGTEAEPYLISNGAELAWAISNGKSGEFYKLVKDIYLNDISKVNWSNGKVQAGYTANTWLKGVSFGANLDGNGFTVNGIYYNAGLTTAQMSEGFEDAAGLIPNVPNAVTVKLSKLGVDYAFVNAKSSAAALIGSVGDNTATDATRATVYIDQCYVGKNVDITAFGAAAFRGYSKNSAIAVKNSYTLATVRSNADKVIDADFNSYNPETSWIIANDWDCDILSVENVYNATGALYKGNWANYKDVFKNSYAAGGVVSADGSYNTVWYTAAPLDKRLSASEMTGLDVFTDAGKMPQLNTAGVYKATAGYPILAVFDKTVVAPTGPWGGVDDVKEPTEGDGSRRNPILIGTAQELAWVIKNGGNDKYYKLTADIVLNDIEKVNWTTGEGLDGYVPQNWYDNAPFSGIIDGDGHVVYGLYFKSPNPSIGWGFYGEGLIPRVNLGKSVTISNLGVDYAYIYSQNGASAFVGFAGANADAERASVSISNCYAGEKVTLKGNDVGVFRGGACKANTTINNAYSLATLDGASTAGLIGNHWTVTVSINNAYNATGKITSDIWLPDVKLVNTYAIDAGAYYDDVVALNVDNMKGPDALTNEAKMPNLNKDGAFIAGDSFPTLAVFSDTGDDDDTPVEVPGQVWTGAIAKDFALGEGTEDDPFVIGTAAELAYAVKNAGFSGKYFKLSHDIYLNDITSKLWYFEDNCNAWLSDTVGFNGHIDGDGHIVYGIWYPEGASNLTAGLIPVFMTGSITNIGVRNAQVNAIESAGGIVGKTVRSGYKYIDSCFVDETVNVSTNHTDYASGGIVGMAYDTTNGAEVTLLIQNCYSKARLSGRFEYRKNGILGGSWRTPYSIKNCYSIGYPVYTTVTAAEYSSAFWNYHPSGDENDKNEARPGKKLSDFISNNYSDTAYVEGTKTDGTSYTVIKNADTMRGTAAKKSMAGLNYTSVYQTVEGGTPKLKIFTSINGKDIVSSKDADFFGEGAGTQKDPFIIKTVEHLRYVVESIDTKGKYYKLGNDIYVNNTKNANWMKNNPAEWYTVDAGAVKFQGHFDGAGHKIYGLYKNDTPTQYDGTGAQWVNVGTALFPYADPEATIRNVHIRDSYLVGKGTVGGIVGNVMLGKESARIQFIACSVDESVTLKGFTVGGILGASHSRGVDLTYCYSTAKMSNTGPSNRLSGLIGDIWGAKASSLESYTTDYQVTFGSLVNTTALYSPVEQFGVTVLDKNSMIGPAAKQNMDFSWDKVWYIEKGKTPQLKVVPYGAEESLYYEGKKGQVWSGKISTGFAGGDGTQKNPYLIETPEQLARIFAVQSSEFTYYKVMADLKLNDTSKANWEETAKMWYAGQYYFRGVFDGNGHVVSGLYYRNENNNDNSWAGLFQAIGHSSTIKRIGVTQSKIINTGNAHTYAAAICGYLEHWRDRGYENATAPVISECFADDSVYCEATAAAGILAATQTTVLIENCYFTGELTGSTYSGAMIADNWAAPGFGPILKGCYGATLDGDALGDGYGDKGFSDESVNNGTAYMYNCYIAGATKSSAIKALSVMYMKGHAAKDYMTAFDFDKVWMTTESGTPVLRCFANAEKYASTRNPKQVQISFGNLGDAVVEPLYGYPGYTPISADELPIPQRRGFIFNGWHHFNPDGANFELTLFPNYDITLYANWTEVGFSQNFDAELDPKYDFNAGIEIFKPGMADYNTKLVHSGWRSLRTIKDSAVDPEFLVSYQNKLIIGYEYEITFWMAAGEDGTSGKLYFEQSNYADVNDVIVGYQEALNFSGLKAGEWKQYTVKVVANAPYLIVRAEKGTTLYFEDFEAIPTGAKGELGNLTGYTPESVGNEPDSDKNNINWLMIAIIAGGVVLLLGAATVVVVITAKKKKA